MSIDEYESHHNLNQQNVFQEKEIQTDSCIHVEKVTEVSGASTLYCWQNSASNEASTQTIIVPSQKIKSKVVVHGLKQSKTIRVGPDSIESWIFGIRGYIKRFNNEASWWYYDVFFLCATQLYSSKRKWTTKLLQNSRCTKSTFVIHDENETWIKLYSYWMLLQDIKNFLFSYFL